MSLDRLRVAVVLASVGCLSACSSGVTAGARPAPKTPATSVTVAAGPAAADPVGAVEAFVVREDELTGDGRPPPGQTCGSVQPYYGPGITQRLASLTMLTFSAPVVVSDSVVEKSLRGLTKVNLQITEASTPDAPVVYSYYLANRSLADGDAADGDAADRDSWTVCGESTGSSLN